MKILVTGASGFVGKAFCNELETYEIDYIPVVRKRTSQFKNKQVIVKELRSTTSWIDVLESVDVVVHLANRAHVMSDVSANPYNEYKVTNVDATVNLAQQAIRAGVKRFIFVSSVKVSGEYTTSKPFNENDIPRPEDDYGNTKLEAELALKELCADSNTELVIIRPPLVYGPNVKANFLNLIKLCNKNLPLPFGTISNKRSFIYIKNLVSFLMLCITHPNAANHTFLVSDNDDQSTASLISIIRNKLNKPTCLIPMPKYILILMFKVLGKKSLINRLLNNLQIDSSKARTLLEWKPPFTFEQGIEQTIKNLKCEEK